MRDALIVVPPFAAIGRPYLGAHVLQSVAGRAGFRVEVLYLNIVFASILGESNYESICYAPPLDLIGERLFAGFLADNCNVQPQSIETINAKAAEIDRRVGRPHTQFTAKHFSDSVGRWLVLATSLICAERDVRVLGFSSTFEQTNAVLVLVKRLRALLIRSWWS
jgi:hypothetical protein